MWKKYEGGDIEDAVKGDPRGEASQHQYTCERDCATGSIPIPKANAPSSLRGPYSFEASAWMRNATESWRMISANYTPSERRRITPIERFASSALRYVEWKSRTGGPD